MFSLLSFLMTALSQEPAKPADAPQETVFKSLVKQVSLDGQIRLRYEYRSPADYVNAVASTRADDVFLERVRLNLKFLATDDIEIFIQPQDERHWGQEPGVVADTQNLDLHQGFFEVRNLLGEPLSIKGGRMELSYGDQRLVSPLDWSNVARAWDGAKIRWSPADWWIEGFFTRIKEGVGQAENNDFFGLYGSYVGVPDHEFDLYAFKRTLRNNTTTDEEGNVGNLMDLTVGARVKGKGMGFDYTVEVMDQTGSFVTDRITAYGYAGTLGYTFEMPWTPRLGVEYTFASGDRRPGDSKHNTFDPLFPFGHYFQGFADEFAFKNGKDAAVYLKGVPATGVSVNVDLHNFWLARDKDAWYNSGGAAVRRDVTGAATDRVGQELDVTTRIAAGKYVKFWAGWSHFFTGPYVSQTPGQDQDMNWYFVQMTVDF